MGTLNYSTQVVAGKTVGEMQAMLSEHGASRIAVDYDQGVPTALAFMLVTPHGPRHFTLPVNVDAMHRSIIQQARDGKLRAMSYAKQTSREQAERVAWRVMKDWLAAQLALVASDMAGLDQVMLPYLHVDGERTLYAAYKDREQAAQLVTDGRDVDVSPPP